MTESLVEIVGRSEEKALVLGDLKTAMRLNWLRNALSSGISTELAFYKFLDMTLEGN